MRRKTHFEGPPGMRRKTHIEGPPGMRRKTHVDGPLVCEEKHLLRGPWYVNCLTAIDLTSHHTHIAWGGGMWIATSRGSPVVTSVELKLSSRSIYSSLCSVKLLDPAPIQSAQVR